MCPHQEVSELLGHANIATTADTYAHVTETMHREAVRTLERVLGL